jgi:hypothetical protein
MYDWTTIGEFIKLPIIPTAMVAYNGRVWIFDENTIVVVDPNGMAIEKVITGIGCLSQRGIIVNNYGMFWCDSKNAYWHDGTNLKPIADTIRADITSTTLWHGFTYTYSSTIAQDQRPIVVFSAIKNYVLFVFPVTGSYANVWAYHVTKNRWDSWGTTTTGFSTVCAASFGMFNGKNGEVYLADGTSKLYDCLGGTSYRLWSWTSKTFDFNEAGQIKEFYWLRKVVSSGASITYTYQVDGGGIWVTMSTDQFGASSYPKNKTIQLALTETGSGASTLDSMEIIYRIMKGAR